MKNYFLVTSVLFLAACASPVYVSKDGSQASAKLTQYCKAAESQAYIAARNYYFNTTINADPDCTAGQLCYNAAGLNASIAANNDGRRAFQSCMRANGYSQTSAQ